MTLPVSYKAAITEDILPFVSKPSRYIAAEWNSVVKDPATTRGAGAYWPSRTSTRSGCPTSG